MYTRYMIRRSQLSRKIRLLLASLLSFGWLLAIPTANAAEGLTAEVYDVLGQNNAPYIPQGASPVLTINVPNINFQWGSGSVLGGPSEDVIVRFTGSIRSTITQNISFLATADDGTKLYIDEVLITNDWRDKGGGGTVSAPISFTAGVPKTIELMYYENGGGASVNLYWNISGSWQIIPAEAFTSQIAVVKTIGAPRNLTVTDSETVLVLAWEAPNTGNTQPERYAINFSTSAGGWGIATGNVGDANALNTTITIPYSTLESLQPKGSLWTFSIRSDNDTNSLYSQISNQVTLKVGKTQAEIDAEIAAQQELSRQTAANNAVSLYESQTVTTLSEVSTAENLKLSADSATAVVLDANIKSSLQSRIDTKTASVLSAKTLLIQAQQEAESETARQNQANNSVSIYESTTMTSLSDYNPITALKDAAQSLVNLVTNLIAKAGFQSRIDYKSSAINNVKAKLEADQAAAIAEAARIESERLAAIAAAQAAAEQARLEAEAKAKAEAEAKAKAEEEEKARIEAEEKAKAEAEEKAKEEAEAKAKAEAEEKARIEAEEKAKAEAEEKERLEAEEKAKEEAEAKAKEKAEAKDKEEKIKAEEAAAKAEEEKEKAEEESKKELEEAIKDAKDGKELTEEQKEAVVESLLENVKPGEAITAAAIAASGISYSDLPPETPVELRTDANGNEVVITAEVAAQVELITDPGAFAQELFSDPGAALAALGSIGADMSDEERKESTEAVVATVIAAGAAINAVAAAGGSAPSGGSTGGGNSGGSGNGSTGSRRNEKW